MGAIKRLGYQWLGCGFIFLNYSVNPSFFSNLHFSPHLLSEPEAAEAEEEAQAEEEEEEVVVSIRFSPEKGEGKTCCLHGSRHVLYARSTFRRIKEGGKELSLQACI